MTFLADICETAVISLVIPSNFKTSQEYLSGESALRISIRDMEEFFVLNEYHANPQFDCKIKFSFNLIEEEGGIEDGWSTYPGQAKTLTIQTPALNSDRAIKYQLVGLVNYEIGYSSEVIDLEVKIKATLSSIYDV